MIPQSTDPHRNPVYAITLPQPPPPPPPPRDDNDTDDADTTSGNLDGLWHDSRRTQYAVAAR
jgi:hypothetical protein